MASTTENINPQTQTPEYEKTIVLVTTTRTIPPIFKATKSKIKKLRKRGEAKSVAFLTSKERSWEWENFMTIDKLIFDTIDGKQVQVGTKK